jgi:23S rRNA (pseudouridine1915-N3)-methyltransferase
VRRPLPPAALKRREAELILAALPARSRLVALDASGGSWSSPEFAERLAQWRDSGVPELAFAIGGAEGLDRPVLDRATAVLSLGPMTWPHRLVRGMLLEQLYRAQQILAGHPYHRT